jgi:ATP-dependent Clp protease ATP-binding subunit ClpA
MKPSQALQIMESVLGGGNTPFLLGGTGVGKSAVVKQLAIKLADSKKLVVDEINPKPKEFGFSDFRLSL